MSKSVPSRDDHKGQEAAGIPQTALMSGAQAKTGLSGSAHGRRAVSSPTSSILLVPPLHARLSIRIHTLRVVRVDLLFSSVPNGPLIHLHAHISTFSSHLHKDFVLSAVSVQYHSGALVCKSYLCPLIPQLLPQNLRCCLLVNNYSTVHIAPFLILSYVVLCSPADDAC
jgi:hypothetical protein